MSTGKKNNYKKTTSPFLLKLKAFFSHWIVKNLLIAIAIVLVLMLSVRIFLSTYTHHGEKILVPDFFSMSIPDAARAAESAGMELVVTDSVYNKRLSPGTIFSQVPQAGTYVKKGRHISVVINSFVPRRIKMPNLVDISLRQAMTNLNAKGLQVGKLIYKSSGEGTNLVLEQRYRGRKIEPGRMVESGATIDLVLGMKSDETNTHVPDVKGKAVREATSMIQDYSLNVRTRFDKEIRTYEDSLRAVVYRQSPEASSLPILRGQEVTLYLRPAESEAE